VIYFLSFVSRFISLACIEGFCSLCVVENQSVCECNFGLLGKDLILFLRCCLIELPPDIQAVSFLLENIDLSQLAGKQFPISFVNP